MTLTKRFVDAEAATKAWAKAQSDVAALVGQRVFLAYNNQAGASPQLVVGRVAGGPQAGDAPLDEATIQFGCWAANRRAAANLAYTVASAAGSMDGHTPMGVEAVGMGARVVLGPLFATSQEDEQAAPPRFRYVVDVTFTLRAQAA